MDIKSEQIFYQMISTHGKWHMKRFSIAFVTREFPIKR